MGSVPVRRTKRAGQGGRPQTFRSPTAVAVWWVWLLFAAANLVDLAVQHRAYISLVAAAILVLATGVIYVGAQRPRIIADDAGITVRNPLRDHHIGWAGVTKIDLLDLLRVHCDWGSQVRARPGSREYSKVISSWAVHHSRRRQIQAEVRARRATALAGSRRSSFGLPYGSDRGSGYASGSARPPASAAEAEAEKIARVLREYATAARAEAVWASGAVDIAGASPGSGTEAVSDTEGAWTAEGARAAEGAMTHEGGVDHHAADSPAAHGGLEDLRHTGWLEPLTSTWSWSAIAALVIPALILLVVCLV